MPWKMSRRNELFIMCDHLGYDYLGCTGHPVISTANNDALAAHGTTDRQPPIYGPSRMSINNGRYMPAHGALSNFAPLRVGERNIGDKLGILFDVMEQRGLLDQTTIVVAADDGDYLCDYWMGDKDKFHAPSVRIPGPPRGKAI